MLLASLCSFLHFIFAFGVVFSILYERLIFRQELTQEKANLIRKLDGLYGFSAIMVLAIGFLRVFYFEKGSEFYFGNPFFHVKLGLFIIIGLLSIYPTIIFYQWRKLDEKAYPLQLTISQYKKIKAILTAETVLAFLLIFSASLMAKGIVIG